MRTFIVSFRMSVKDNQIDQMTQSPPPFLISYNSYYLIPILIQLLLFLRVYGQLNILT